MIPNHVRVKLIEHRANIKRAQNDLADAGDYIRNQQLVGTGEAWAELHAAYNTLTHTIDTFDKLIAGG